MQMTSPWKVIYSCPLPFPPPSLPEFLYKAALLRTWLTVRVCTPTREHFQDSMLGFPCSSAEVHPWWGRKALAFANGNSAVPEEALWVVPGTMVLTAAGTLAGLAAPGASRTTEPAE